MRSLVDSQIRIEMASAVWCLKPSAAFSGCESNERHQWLTIHPQMRSVLHAAAGAVHVACCGHEYDRGAGVLGAYGCGSQTVLHFRSAFRNPAGFCTRASVFVYMGPRQSYILGLSSGTQHQSSKIA
eukprot:1143871-Pelagomonas_calceolata.AAC.3